MGGEAWLVPKTLGFVQRRGTQDSSGGYRHTYRELCRCVASGDVLYLQVWYVDRGGVNLF